MPPRGELKLLARRQQARLKQYRKSLRIEHKHLVDEMKKEAIRLTSGSMSYAQLKALNHPFGRKKLLGKIRGVAPKLPINRHGAGRLQKSLRVIPTDTGFRLQFTAPEAKFVLRRRGTKKMIARGFWLAMAKAYGRASRRMEKKTIYHANLAGLRRKYARRTA